MSTSGGKLERLLALTAALLETLFQMDSRVSYILLSRNFGHQAALTAGFDHANAEIVISMMELM